MCLGRKMWLSLRVPCALRVTWRMRDRCFRWCSAMPFPNVATRFKRGNPGRPRHAPPVSKRRARRLVAQAIIAEAAGPYVPDFMGDALGYLQACYTGRIKPDPLRLSAAV